MSKDKYEPSLNSVQARLKKPKLIDELWLDDKNLMFMRYVAQQKAKALYEEIRETWPKPGNTDIFFRVVHKKLQQPVGRSPDHHFTPE